MTASKFARYFHLILYTLNNYIGGCSLIVLDFLSTLNAKIY
jgi:hypothetical protein